MPYFPSLFFFSLLLFSSFPSTRPAYGAVLGVSKRDIERERDRRGVSDLGCVCVLVSPNYRLFSIYICFLFLVPPIFFLGVLHCTRVRSISLFFFKKVAWLGEKLQEKRNVFRTEKEGREREEKKGKKRDDFHFFGL